jgi:hypothetical protein
VYSSRYSSEDEAERILRSFVGRGDEDVATKHIGMRVGRSRNTWVNNCVAVGLAAGFVEPLESTGLFLVQHGIEQLVKNWPGAQWDDGLRRSYKRTDGELHRRHTRVLGAALPRIGAS